MQRLVDWLIELRKVEVQTLQIWGKDIELWRGLPLLGPEWAEWAEGYYVAGDDPRNNRFRKVRDSLDRNGGYALWNYWK
jgi:hypothetical protein